MKIGLFFELERARTWLLPGGAKWLLLNCLFQLCLFNEAIVPGYETILRHIYGTPEGTFLFQYLPEKKLKQQKIGKEIKTIISCLNDLSSFLSNIEQNRN